MMTLQEALAEVKAVPLGDASWPALNAILKAVASGDLIPKSEAGEFSSHSPGPQPGEVPASSAPALIPKAVAEMAVALAYQRAAHHIVAEAEKLAGGMQQVDPALAFLKELAAEILALADADALAEVREWKRLAIAGNLVALEMRQIEARAEAAEAEVARLKVALEWYGEQARLCRLIHSEGDAARQALAHDGGNRARAALTTKGTPVPSQGE